jgi:hypothetical protein
MINDILLKIYLRNHDIEIFQGVNFDEMLIEEVLSSVSKIKISNLTFYKREYYLIDNNICNIHNNLWFEWYI